MSRHVSTGTTTDRAAIPCRIALVPRRVVWISNGTCGRSIREVPEIRVWSRILETSFFGNDCAREVAPCVWIAPSASRAVGSDDDSRFAKALRRYSASEERPSRGRQSLIRRQAFVGRSPERDLVRRAASASRGRVTDYVMRIVDLSNRAPQDGRFALRAASAAVRRTRRRGGGGRRATRRTRTRRGRGVWSS